jgi:glutathione S-transferase
MLKLYHAPWSRGSAMLWLLEELGVDYELVEIDIRAEDGVPESYRAIQPNKKVPAIELDGVVVTERAAITIFLADRFPAAGLAPAIATRPRHLSHHAGLLRRGSGSVHLGAGPWARICRQRLFLRPVRRHGRLSGARAGRAPLRAGDRFTAADIQLASSIGFTMNQLKVLPEKPVFVDYLGRVLERPANKRAEAKDSELAMKTPFFQAMFAAEARADHTAMP